MTDPQELVEEALKLSTADGCVALVSEQSETNLRWAANSLTTNGQMRSRAMTVISTSTRGTDTSAGVITRSVASPEEVADLVRESEDAARHAEPAEDAAPLVEPYRHDDDWSAPPARTSVTVFEQFTDELARLFGRWTKADQLLYGYAEHELVSTFLGTSTGLRRRFDQPTGRLEINGKSADLRRSSWAGLHTRDFTDVDLAGVTDDLERRLGWATTELELPAGRYETIVPPTSVADLMIYAYWTASARDAEEGRNVFAGPDGTRIGEQLAGTPLTLHSDPDHPGLQCPSFEIAPASFGGLLSVFDNGQPADAATWIDKGKLNDLIRTRAWAQRSGNAPRPYVDNLILDAGPEATADLDAMIADTERGLLLTCMWYIREVDPQTLLLTGLTRDGVFLVENGRVRGAVNNFRFNESPVDLLGRASQAGKTVPTLSREWSDDFRRTAMPPLRIPDFNMSTVSKAR